MLFNLRHMLPNEHETLLLFTSQTVISSNITGGEYKILEKKKVPVAKQSQLTVD